MWSLDGEAAEVDQILASAFSSHTEPAWVLEVRRDRDRWLGSNPAADALLERLGVPSDNLEVVLGRLGVPRSLIMGGLWTLGSFSTSTEHGIVHATRLTAYGRPALMVVSLHPDGSEAHAWAEHSRLVIALRVNEEATSAIEMTRSAVVQLEGVVGKLQDMLHDFNEQMQVTRTSPRRFGGEHLSTEALTASQDARQG